MFDGCNENLDSLLWCLIIFSGLFVIEKEE
jgi:hypothetical protein